MQRQNQGGLCLTRKLNQAIIIEVAGQTIELCITKLTPSQCRILFVADKDQVKIHREECYEAELAKRQTV